MLSIRWDKSRWKKAEGCTEGALYIFITQFSQANIKRGTANLAMLSSLAPTNCWLCHKVQNSASEWHTLYLKIILFLILPKRSLCYFCMMAMAGLTPRTRLKMRIKRRKVNVPVVLEYYLIHLVESITLQILSHFHWITPTGRMMSCLTMLWSYHK